MGRILSNHMFNMKNMFTMFLFLPVFLSAKETTNSHKNTGSGYDVSVFSVSYSSTQTTIIWEVTKSGSFAIRNFSIDEGWSANVISTTYSNSSSGSWTSAVASSSGKTYVKTIVDNIATSKKTVKVKFDYKKSGSEYDDEKIEGLEIAGKSSGNSSSGNGQSSDDKKDEDDEDKDPCKGKNVPTINVKKFRFCEGQNAEIELTSSNEQESEYSKHSFSWKNDDGDNGSSKKFKISSDKSGSHKVHVKVDNEGCATEDDIDVEIAPNPTADFNHDGDDESLCEGESIKYSASKKDGHSYTWNVDGDDNEGEEYEHSKPSVGEHTIKLKVSDANGCVSAEKVQKYTVHKNPKGHISHEGDNELCDGESIKLKATVEENEGKISKYSWTSTEGNHEGEEHEVKPSVGKHSYRLKFEDEHGCASDEAVEEVEVHENPRVEIEHDGDNSLCDGESIKLHAKHEGGGSNHSIKWSNGSESQEGEDHEVKPSIGKHHYTVKVEDEHGCSSNEAGEDVEVHENPKGDIETDDNDLCDGESVKLKAKSEGGGANHSYTWKRDNESEERTGDSREDQPSVGEHHYKMIVRDEHGCVSQEDDQIVNVHGRPSKPSGYDETHYFLAVPKKVKADKEAVINALNWYANYQSSEKSSDAPIQPTDKEGQFHYYPSQTNQYSCEGDKDDVQIDVKNPVRHTLTHGFYGSKKGKVCYDGVLYKTPLEFLQKAIGANNIISVGKANGEYKGSFTILYNQLVDLNKVLPFAEGKDESLNAHYTFSDFSKKDKQGKIRNPLVSQLIAMAINLSADEKLNKNANALGTLDLKNAAGKWIVTRKAPSCITDKESECDHDGDEEERDARDQLKSRFIPKSVIDALNASGKTSVRDLYEYASKGTFATGVSVSDVRKALAAINEAFEGGRYMVEFADKQKREIKVGSAAMQIGAMEEVSSAMNNTKASVAVSTFPNPYTDKITFRLTAKQTGKAALVLYNLAGQKVATVFEGSMQANATQTVEYNVPSAQRGNLIFVFNNGATNTTGKIVSAKR